MSPSKEQQRSIVVADDEPLMRELIMGLLESADYAVHHASDADGLIDVVERLGSEIDLLVVDVTMPGMTGPEAVRKIRERHEGLPVLYLSGHDAKFLDNLYAERGPTRAIQKPFEAAELIRTVRQLLDGPPADDETL